MSRFLEKIKGYKSVTFFLLALAVAVAGIVAPEDLKVTENQAEWLALLIPLIGLILRKVTDTPIGGARRFPRGEESNRKEPTARRWPR